MATVGERGGDAKFGLWGVRERMKSVIMDFCFRVKEPYQKREIGMWPCSRGPLWYVKMVGGGWYRDARESLIKERKRRERKDLCGDEKDMVYFHLFFPFFCGGELIGLGSKGVG